MSEKVDHPPHYGGDTIYETIKVLEAWLTGEEFIGFLKGNAIKYQSRHRLKGGLEDLQKAAWYSNYLADFVRRAKVKPVNPFLHPLLDSSDQPIVEETQPSRVKVELVASRKRLGRTKAVLARMEEFDTLGRRIGKRALRAKA